MAGFQLLWQHNTMVEERQNCTFVEILPVGSPPPSSKFVFCFQDLWTYVDPTSESTFPGIHDLRTQLKQWEWVYGHTPKFQIQRSFDCHVLDEDVQVSVDLEVVHGRVKNSDIRVVGCRSDMMRDKVAGICHRISTDLNGQRFWPSDIIDLEELVVSLQTFIDTDLVVWTRSIFKCVQNSVLGK